MSGISIELYENSKNDDYIFAGQLIMWDYISDNEKDVVGNPFEAWNPLYMESWTINNASEYKTEINEIRSEVENYDVIPSFMGSATSPKGHTLKYDKEADNFSLTLTDSNGVWDERFAKYGDFEGYELSNPSGADNVKITTKNVNTSFTSVYKSSYKLGADNNYYDAGQDLIRVSGDEIVAGMKFKTATKPKGGFILKKVDYDSGEPIGGVEFSLYDDDKNFIEKYISDDQGLISTGKSLESGHYNLIETKAAEGYILPENIIYSITIKADEIQDYSDKEKTNEKIKGGFELTKVGIDSSGDSNPLSGVEFKVEGITNQSFSKVYTTDEEGKIVTSDDELEYGSYVISESSSLPGYVGDFKEQFTIESDGQIIKLNQSDSIINDLYWNKITFQKNGETLNGDSDEIVPLIGTEFELYKESGEANQLIDEEDQLIAVLTSDENGIVTSPPLTIGDYLLVETKSNFGYDLSSEIYSFTISINENNKQIIDLGDYQNDLLYGSAYLTKHVQSECVIDELLDNCEKPLQGIEFSIYQDINNNQMIDEDDIYLDTIVTDSDGVANISNLKYGNYVVVESFSPYENYLSSEVEYPFVINSDAVVPINDGKAIINVEKMGQISLTKTSAQTGDVLSGAQYGIYNSDGQLIEELKTDDTGSATSTKLSFGNYYLKELIAPKGYSIDDREFGFTINDQTYEEIQQIELVDDLMTNQISVSKVDYSSGNLIAGAELEIYDRQSNEIITKWESITKPHVVELNYGKYGLRETKAPDGYKKTSKVVKFDVVEDGENQDLIISNVKLTELMATGSKIGLLLITLLFIIIIILFVKKVNSKEKSK